jgi:hypothetical protein
MAISVWPGGRGSKTTKKGVPSLMNHSMVNTKYNLLYHTVDFMFIVEKGFFEILKFHSRDG